MLYRSLFIYCHQIFTQKPFLEIINWNNDQLAKIQSSILTQPDFLLVYFLLANPL